MVRVLHREGHKRLQTTNLDNRGWPQWQLALRFRSRASKRANSLRQYQDPRTGRPETGARKPTIRQELVEPQETLGTQLKGARREADGTALTTTSIGPAHIQLDRAECIRPCPKQRIQRTTKDGQRNLATAPGHVLHQPGRQRTCREIQPLTEGSTPRQTIRIHTQTTSAHLNGLPPGARRMQTRV